MSPTQDRLDLFWSPCKQRCKGKLVSKLQHPTFYTLAWKNRQSYRAKMYPFVTVTLRLLNAENSCLKGHRREIFCHFLFHESKPSGPLLNRLKWFCFKVCFLWICLFCFTLEYTLYEQT